jgi:hypothetical protein
MTLVRIDEAPTSVDVHSDTQALLLSSHAPHSPHDLSTGTDHP